MMERPDSLMIPECFIELLWHQYLIKIMHFFISITIIILSPGMLHYGVAGIKLEAINSLIDKVRQVIEPVFLS